MRIRSDGGAVYRETVTNSVTLFLGGARTVAEAVSDPRVGQAWDQPSVFEEQTVGGLAGHLARGGVWVVADYLHANTPQGPADFDSPAEYCASFADAAQPEDHRAVRDRTHSLLQRHWLGSSPIRLRRLKQGSRGTRWMCIAACSLALASPFVLASLSWQKNASF